jgi:hypothetical protein
MVPSASAAASVVAAKTSSMDGPRPGVTRQTPATNAQTVRILRFSLGRFTAFAAFLIASASDGGGLTRPRPKIHGKDDPAENGPTNGLISAGPPAMVSEGVTRGCRVVSKRPDEDPQFNVKYTT